MKKNAIHSFLILLYLLVIIKLPGKTHVCLEDIAKVSCCFEKGCSDLSTEDSILFLEASCCADIQQNTVVDSEHNSSNSFAFVKTAITANSSPNNFIIKGVESYKTLSLLRYYSNFIPPVLLLYKVYKQYIVYHINN